MIDDAASLESHLQAELGKVLFGLEDIVHALVIALVARGHVLLEGPPGLGKTLLGKTFAGAIGGSFKRIQGTADLMPSDITGVHVYDTEARSFEFQRGPVFADVVLVDEINRAGPKTQSALLEAMEERQVTADRDTFALHDDFMVIATQNPQEFEGTYPLPESQLDRFALSTRLSYPAREQEMHVLETYSLPGGATSAGDGPAVQALPEGAVTRARAAIANVHLSPELMTYVLDVAAATRDSASVTLGLSTRGALVLARAARVEAALRGGGYVVPDDVKRVAPWVVRHRLVLAPEAALEGQSADVVFDRIMEHVAVPH